MSLKMSLALTLMAIFINIVWAAPSGRSSGGNTFQRRQKRADKIKYDPIPENGKVPGSLPGKTYYRAEATKDVHYILKDGAVAMFVVTRTGVVVVDQPPSIGQDILSAIKDVTNLPVTHIIYTHSHGDHIGAATLFKNAQIIAHSETEKVLKERKDPLRPLPTRTFSDTLTMNIGGKKFQLDYHGPLHTPGNIFVYLPREQVLYTADITSPGSAQYTNLGVAEDIVAFMEAPNIILSYPFIYFLGGHARLGNRQDVLNQREYLQDIQKNVIASRLTGAEWQEITDSLDDSSKTNGDLVGFLGSQKAAAKCAKLTSDKWKTTLGNVDVYGPSHCLVTSIAQGIDFGPNKVIGG